MEQPRAGTLLGEESGAALDDISWTRLTPWRDEIVRLDRELRPDLSNLNELLRRIPVAVWGQLLFDPARHFGRADLFLPQMPDATIQEAWTGLSGGRLLRQSIAFIDRIVNACAEAGVSPFQARVLDFGVGWGRLAMLLLKYTRPQNLVGCDAWESSLEEARRLRLPIELKLSDPLLDTLPVAASSLDVAYAFSVFTSLGPNAFPKCLSGLARTLKPGGVVLFTVRPPEYWALRRDAADALRTAERSEFHFRPYRDRDEYGDTSVSLDYLDQVCLSSGLGRPSLEWAPVDPHQLVVCARKPIV